MKSLIVARLLLSAAAALALAHTSPNGFTLRFASAESGAPPLNLCPSDTSVPATEYDYQDYMGGFIGNECTFDGDQSFSLIHASMDKTVSTHLTITQSQFNGAKLRISAVYNEIDQDIFNGVAAQNIEIRNNVFNGLGSGILMVDYLARKSTVLIIGNTFNGHIEEVDVGTGWSGNGCYAMSFFLGGIFAGTTMTISHNTIADFSCDADQFTKNTAAAIILGNLNAAPDTGAAVQWKTNVTLSYNNIALGCAAANATDCTGISAFGVAPLSIQSGAHIAIDHNDVTINKGSMSAAVYFPSFGFGSSNYNASYPVNGLVTVHKNLFTTNAAGAESSSTPAVEIGKDELGRTTPDGGTLRVDHNNFTGFNYPSTVNFPTGFVTDSIGNTDRSPITTINMPLIFSFSGNNILSRFSVGINVKKYFNTIDGGMLSIDENDWSTVSGVDSGTFANATDFPEPTDVSSASTLFSFFSNLAPPGPFNYMNPAAIDIFTGNNGRNLFCDATNSDNVNQCTRPDDFQDYMEASLGTVSAAAIALNTFYCFRCGCNDNPPPEFPEYCSFQRYCCSVSSTMRMAPKCPSRYEMMSDPYSQKLVINNGESF